MFAVPYSILRHGTAFLLMDRGERAPLNDREGGGRMTGRGSE